MVRVGLDKPTQYAVWRDMQRLTLSIQPIVAALIIVAVGCFSSSSGVHNERGLLYVEQGALEKAIREFDKAIEIDQAMAETYNNRGAIYIRLDRYQQALQDFDKSIELDPGIAEVFNNRGLTLDR